jgi:hypothetical protein
MANGDIRKKYVVYELTNEVLDSCVDKRIDVAKMLASMTPWSTNVEHGTSWHVIHHTDSLACRPLFSLFAGISLVLADCGPVKLIYTHAADADPAPYLLARYRIRYFWLSEIASLHDY